MRVLLHIFDFAGSTKSLHESQMYNASVCTHLSNGPLIAFSVGLCNILNPELHELTDVLFFVCFVNQFVQMKACCLLSLGS